MTGNPALPSANRADSDTSVIGRDRLDLVAGGRLEIALAGVASVQTFRRSDSSSSHPTSGGLSMRALGGNAASRTLLVLDGVPQADPFGGWVPFEAYPLNSLGAAVVTRGGGGARWGSGALAGTIELQSAPLPTAAQVSGYARGGSRSSADAGARASWRDADTYVDLSVQGRRSDGFIPVVAGDRGPADTAAPYRQGSAQLRAGTGLGGGLELQATLRAFADRRARGVDDSDNRTDGRDASLRLLGRGERPFEVTAYWQHRRFASQFASVDAGRTTSTLVLDQYAVPARGGGVRAERVMTGGPVIVRLGGDWRMGSGSTNERYLFVNDAPTRERHGGGRFATSGLFVEAARDRPGITWSASARLDRWRLSPGYLREANIGGSVLRDDRFQARAGWASTARGSLGWRGEAVDVYAAAYTGWRLPTLNELYRPFRVGNDVTAANPDLEPERLAGGEVGASWRPVGGVKLSSRLFAARLRHAIANITLGTGPGTFPGVGFVAAGGAYRQRRNVDAIVSRGIEVDAEATRGRLTATLSASWAHARVEASGDAAAIDGFRPALTPATSVAGTVAWKPRDGALLGVTARYSGRQFEDDLESEPLAPALTFDAAGTWPLSRRLALTLDAENLFDRRVEAAINSDGSVERANPRTLWVGLRFR